MQTTVEKQNQKKEMEKAISELKQVYDEKKAKIVTVTPGSPMDEALRNYERRERVAQDIRKDVVKKRGAEEQGKE